MRYRLRARPVGIHHRDRRASVPKQSTDAMKAIFFPSGDQRGGSEVQRGEFPRARRRRGLGPVTRRISM